MLFRTGWTEAQVDAVDDHLLGLDWNAYECADNFRFAREGTPDEVAYEEQVRSGCCAFYDEVVDTPDGRVRVGFNYGH